MTLASSPETSHLRALSQLTLNQQEPGSSTLQEALNYISRLDASGRKELLSLADSHHVLGRALQAARVGAPLLFGWIIGAGSSRLLFGGYVVAAALMLFAATMEAWLGVPAERRSLEHVAAPLSSKRL